MLLRLLSRERVVPATEKTFDKRYSAHKTFIVMKSTKKIVFGVFLFLFLGGGSASAETLWANGVSKESGWFDFNKTYDDNRDEDHCWAAASSNIINWWQKQYKLPSYIPQEEDIWEIYKRSFTGGGSNPIQGFSWWLDGSYALPSTNAARLKSGADAAGYYDAYVEDPRDHIRVGQGVHDVVCKFIVDSLNDGCGVSLSLSMGHEVTLWGVELDLVSGAITKIWLTDSDDEQKGQNLEGIFAVGCYEYKYMGSETETYLGLEDYWGNKGGDVFVQMVTALAPVDFLPLIPEPSAFGLLAGIVALALAGTRRSRHKGNR